MEVFRYTHTHTHTHTHKIAHAPTHRHTQWFMQPDLWQNECICSTSK